MTTVVDSNDVMPNSSGTFQQIRPPSISDDGTIAFSAVGTEILPDGTDFSGVYTSLGEVLSVVADTTMLTPDGTRFLAFDPGFIPVWEDTVAFVAYDLMTPDIVRHALYLSKAGTFYNVLTIGHFDIPSQTWTNETFDGRVLQLILLSQDSIEGNTLAFSAVFQDGAMGVYTADINVAAVPEPSSLALLGLTGIGFAGARWRGRRNSGSRGCAGRAA